LIAELSAGGAGLAFPFFVVVLGNMYFSKNYYYL